MSNNVIEETLINRHEINELNMSEKREPKHLNIDDSTKPEDKQENVDAKALENEAEVIEAGESIEEKLRQEVLEAKDRTLRLAAEFDNFKKISQREQQNGIRFANEALITGLLPIIDSLEQGIEAQKKEGAKAEIVVGIEMALKQLIDLLTKFGVEVFSAQGQAFDPNRHEALSELENDTFPTGTVVTEYQKGYLLHGRLLRPARVVVSKKSGNK